MEKNAIEQELKKISNIDSNKYCFDCLAQPANFASISEGIFLCLTCSGEHRGFTNPRTIKSITLDDWKPEEVKMMAIGGNRNLRKLLNANPIPKEKKTKKDVYTSKLMHNYRLKLKALANDENHTDIPLKNDEKYEVYLGENKLKLVDEIDDKNSDPEDDEIYKPNSENEDKLFYKERMFNNPIYRENVFEKALKDIENGKFSGSKNIQIKNKNIKSDNYWLKDYLYKAGNYLINTAYNGINYGYNYLKSFFVKEESQNNNSESDDHYYYSQNANENTKENLIEKLDK